MSSEKSRSTQPTRRDLIKGLGAGALAVGLGRHVDAAETETSPSTGEAIRSASAPVGPPGNNIYFEKELKRMRFDLYHHPPINILKGGFRPVGGRPADFAVIHHDGREHFFYIERRLVEGTPFFPGHEIYFGHASTADFFNWEVHEPVLLVRPGTWEEGHVWAPNAIKHGDEYVMVYTGLNRHLSQDLGVATSRDMFEWKRWESNPISLLKEADWAAWWTDEICSCRDPHLLRHDGRIWMVFTANTKKGASCLALASTEDFKTWTDHGPIITGPETGYEPHLWGGHPQGSLESATLLYREGRWILVFNVGTREKARGVWIVESDRMDRFDFDKIRRFESGGCVEVVRDQGSRSLLVGLRGEGLMFDVVDWADPEPTARPATREDLLAWQKVPPLQK